MLKLSVISEEEIEAIHNATLRILAETGVVLTHSEGRAILEAEGAIQKGDRVLLPPDLVEKMLKRCVNEVKLRGRGGSTVILGGGVLHWHNLGGARDIYDYRTDTRRGAVAQDVRAGGTVACSV